MSSQANIGNTTIEPNSANSEPIMRNQSVGQNSTTSEPNMRNQPVGENTTSAQFSKWLQHFMGEFKKVYGNNYLEYRRKSIFTEDDGNTSALQYIDKKMDKSIEYFSSKPVLIEQAKILIEQLGPVYNDLMDLHSKENILMNSLAAIGDIVRSQIDERNKHVKIDLMKQMGTYPEPKEDDDKYNGDRLQNGSLNAEGTRKYEEDRQEYEKNSDIADEILKTLAEGFANFDEIYENIKNEELVEGIGEDERLVEEMRQKYEEYHERLQMMNNVVPIAPITNEDVNSVLKSLMNEEDEPLIDVFEYLEEPQFLRQSQPGNMEQAAGGYGQADEGKTPMHVDGEEYSFHKIGYSKSETVPLGIKIFTKPILDENGKPKQMIGRDGNPMYRSDGTTPKYETRDPSDIMKKLLKQIKRSDRLEKIYIVKKSNKDFKKIVESVLYRCHEIDILTAIEIFKVIYFISNIVFVSKINSNMYAAITKVYYAMEIYYQRDEEFMIPFDLVKQIMKYIGTQGVLIDHANTVESRMKQMTNKLGHISTIGTKDVPLIQKSKGPDEKLTHKNIYGTGRDDYGLKLNLDTSPTQTEEQTENSNGQAGGGRKIYQFYNQYGGHVGDDALPLSGKSVYMTLGGKKYLFHPEVADKLSKATEAQTEAFRNAYQKYIAEYENGRRLPFTTYEHFLPGSNDEEEKKKAAHDTIQRAANIFKMDNGRLKNILDDWGIVPIPDEEGNYSNNAFVQTGGGKKRLFDVKESEVKKHWDTIKNPEEVSRKVKELFFRCYIVQNLFIIEFEKAMTAGSILLVKFLIFHRLTEIYIILLSLLHVIAQEYDDVMIPPGVVETADALISSNKIMKDIMKINSEFDSGIIEKNGNVELNLKNNMLGRLNTIGDMLTTDPVFSRYGQTVLPLLSSVEFKPVKIQLVLDKKAAEKLRDEFDFLKKKFDNAGEFDINEPTPEQFNALNAYNNLWTKIINSYSNPMKIFVQPIGLDMYEQTKMMVSNSFATLDAYLKAPTPTPTGTEQPQPQSGGGSRSKNKKSRRVNVKYHRQSKKRRFNNQYGGVKDGETTDGEGLDLLSTQIKDDIAQTHINNAIEAQKKSEQTANKLVQVYDEDMYSGTRNKSSDLEIGASSGLYGDDPSKLRQYNEITGFSPPHSPTQTPTMVSSNSSVAQRIATAPPATTDDKAYYYKGMGPLVYMADLGNGNIAVILSVYARDVTADKDANGIEGISTKFFGELKVGVNSTNMQKPENLNEDELKNWWKEQYNDMAEKSKAEIQKMKDEEKERRRQKRIQEEKNEKKRQERIAEDKRTVAERERQHKEEEERKRKEKEAEEAAKREEERLRKEEEEKQREKERKKAERNKLTEDDEKILNEYINIGAVRDELVNIKGKFFDFEEHIEKMTQEKTKPGDSVVKVIKDILSYLEAIRAQGITEKSASESLKNFIKLTYEHPELGYYCMNKMNKEHQMAKYFELVFKNTPEENNNLIKTMIPKFTSLIEMDMNKDYKISDGTPEGTSLSDAIVEVNETILGQARVIVAVREDFRDMEGGAHDKKVEQFNKAVKEKKITPILHKTNTSGCVTVTKVCDEEDKEAQKTGGQCYGVFKNVFENEGVKHVFDTEFEQAKLIDKTIMKGSNLIIFGYGFSGSGKTYLLLGDKENNILKRTVEYLNQLNVKPKSVEFKELYPVENGIGDFQVISNYQQETQAINNTVENVDTFLSTLMEQFGLITKKRMAKLRILPTPNNPESSRSHMFISIKFSLDGGKEGKLTLVDMAGAENTIEIKQLFLVIDTLHKKDKEGNVILDNGKPVIDNIYVKAKSGKFIQQTYNYDSGHALYVNHVSLSTTQYINVLRKYTVINSSKKNVIKPYVLFNALMKKEDLNEHYLVELLKKYKYVKYDKSSAKKIKTEEINNKTVVYKKVSGSFEADDYQQLSQQQKTELKNTPKKEMIIRTYMVGDNEYQFDRLGSKCFDTTNNALTALLSLVEIEINFTFSQNDFDINYGNTKDIKKVNSNKYNEIIEYFFKKLNNSVKIISESSEITKFDSEFFNFNTPDYSLISESDTTKYYKKILKELDLDYLIKAEVIVDYLGKIKINKVENDTKIEGLSGNDDLNKNYHMTVYNGKMDYEYSHKSNIYVTNPFMQILLTVENIMHDTLKKNHQNIQDNDDQQNIWQNFVILSHTIILKVILGYVNYIVKQGKGIVTTLEHLKYMFLYRTNHRSGIRNYNASNPTEKQFNNMVDKIYGSSQYKVTKKIKGKVVTETVEMGKIARTKMIDLLNEFSSSSDKGIDWKQTHQNMGQVGDFSENMSEEEKEHFVVDKSTGKMYKILKLPKSVDSKFVMFAAILRGFPKIVNGEVVYDKENSRLTKYCGAATDTLKFAKEITSGDGDCSEDCKSFAHYKHTSSGGGIRKQKRSKRRGHTQGKRSRRQRQYRQPRIVHVVAG